MSAAMSYAATLQGEVAPHVRLELCFLVGLVGLAWRRWWLAGELARGVADGLDAEATLHWREGRSAYELAKGWRLRD